MIAPLERLRDRAQEWLASRLVWLTSRRSDFRGQETAAPALVVVIGREHYDERRIAYPIRSWFELTRVLRLDRPDPTATLAIIGPLAEDRREVTFFDLHPSVREQAGQSAFWIPESLLLARGAERGEVVTIERSDLRYFLARDALSQRAGGLVRSPELFAFAGGIAAERFSHFSDERELRDRLRSSLAQIDLSVWAQTVSPSLKEIIGVYWKPVTAIATAALVAYLVLASAYLGAMNWWRERQIAALGPEVSVLLESQRHSDQMAGEQRGAAKVLAGRRPTYFVWQVAAKVWEKSGMFDGLTWSDDQLLVRGRALNAIDLLKAISALPGVEGAKFVAPVTDDAGMQSFAIKLKLAETGV